eukprot:225196_1
MAAAVSEISSDPSDDSFNDLYGHVPILEEPTKKSTQPELLTISAPGAELDRTAPRIIRHRDGGYSIDFGDMSGVRKLIEVKRGILIRTEGAYGGKVNEIFVYDKGTKLVNPTDYDVVKWRAAHGEMLRLKHMAARDFETINKELHQDYENELPIKIEFGGKTYPTLKKTEAPVHVISKAHSGYNNLDYRSLFDDSAPLIHHYENVLQLDPPYSIAHYEDGEYYNGLMLGGVIGGGSIVAILVVFCLGLAFGMLVCFGYQQKKSLEESKNEDWRQNDDV